MTDRPEGMSDRRLAELKLAVAPGATTYDGIDPNGRCLSCGQQPCECEIGMLREACREIDRLRADGATLQQSLDKLAAAEVDRQMTCRVCGTSAVQPNDRCEFHLSDAQRADMCQTEREHVNAWRKRANEAEAAGATLRERVEAALTDSVVRDAAVDAWQANDHEFFDPPTFRHRILKAIFPASAPKEPTP